MANEITIGVLLEFAKGTKSGNTRNWSIATEDMSGTDYVHRTQILSTTDEALGLGEITTPGWIAIRNNDATDAAYLARPRRRRQLHRITSRRCTVVI